MPWQQRHGTLTGKSRSGYWSQCLSYDHVSEFLLSRLRPNRTPFHTKDKLAVQLGLGKSLQVAA